MSWVDLVVPAPRPIVVPIILLAARLESKAADLRKAGHKTDADELLRLREMFAAGK